MSTRIRILNDYYIKLDLTYMERQGKMCTIIKDLPKGTILEVDGIIVLHKF